MSPYDLNDLSRDINQVDYFDATLRAILDGHPQSGIEDLMLWRYALPSSLAPQDSSVALTANLKAMHLMMPLSAVSGRISQTWTPKAY